MAFHASPLPALQQSGLVALLGRHERLGWEFRPPPVATRSDLRNHPPADPGMHQLWREAIDREERALDDARSRSFLWWPVGPSRSYPIITVFGGTALGWRCLLVGATMSLLGSGYKVAVLNLSEWALTDQLVEAASLARFEVVHNKVSAEGSSFDPYAGLGPDALANLVLAVAAGGDAAGVRSELMEDRSLLRRVLGHLAPPVTLSKLGAALRVVLRDEPAPGPGSLLSTEEFRALTSLFRQQLRDRGHVVERAERLESHVAELARFAPHVSAARRGGSPDLTVVDAALDAELLDVELGIHVVSQAALRSLRGASSMATSFLVVLSGERVAPATLRSLAAAAAQQNVRLLILVPRLGDAGAELLQLDDACVGFMRLSHPDDAARAAAVIGRERRFQVSSRATTKGGGRSTSGGQQSSDETGNSESQGPMFFERTSGTSAGHSQGTNTGWGTEDNWGTTDTVELVHEFVVEPEQIQRLSATSLVLTEPQEGTPPRFLDVDPNIVSFARVRP